MDLEKIKNLKDILASVDPHKNPDIFMDETGGLDGYHPSKKDEAVDSTNLIKRSLNFPRIHLLKMKFKKAEF